VYLVYFSIGYGPSPQNLQINKMANANQREGENISKDVSHIPKFNGKNYPSWKYGVWLLSRQHGLTEIVENNATKPAEVRYELQNSQLQDNLCSVYSPNR
jgi:hypothetical protein